MIELPTKEMPEEIVVISRSPIMGDALALLLREKIGIGSVLTAESERPEGLDLPRPCTLVIVATELDELVRLIPPLRKTGAHCPWLLLADLCLAGAVLSFVEDVRCTAVDPAGSVEGLRDGLQALHESTGLDFGAELLARCQRYRLPLELGRHTLPLTPREVQCGCAAALGLTNARMGQMMHREESTVKSHLHNLMEKLGVSSREEAGEFVKRALRASIAR